LLVGSFKPIPKDYLCGMALKKFPKKLIGYLFRGMLLTIPLAVTVYVLVSVFVTVDHIIPSTVFGPEIPGLGILFLLAIFLVLGWLGGTFIAQPLIKYFNRLLDQVPLIKTIYNSVKDLLSAFVGEKKSFNVPVIIRLHEQYEIEQIGFITSEDLSPLGEGPEKVAVYIPYSYSFAGNLFIVPKKNIRVLPHKAPEIMKFIVSGGVSELEHSKPH
jgi:uncharacterized membrane protein